MHRTPRDTTTTTIDNCHQGVGTILCRTLLDHADSNAGIRFAHETTLPPGTSIGHHTHTHDEEIYHNLEGTGLLTTDGITRAFNKGDTALVKQGGSHALTNNSPHPLRILVVCVAPR